MSTLNRHIEVLRFETAGRSFCLDVDQVLGVITLPASLKEPPQVVPFHDDEVRVYSLDKLLDFGGRPVRCPQEIIVLAGTTENYGISVDLIGQIYKIPIQRSVFRFPASRPSGIKMFGIWGMAVLGGDLALILEPQELLREQTGRRTGAEAPAAGAPTPSPEPRCPPPGLPVDGRTD